MGLLIPAKLTFDWERIAAESPGTGNGGGSIAECIVQNFELRSTALPPQWNLLSRAIMTVLDEHLLPHLQQVTSDVERAVRPPKLPPDPDTTHTTAPVR